MWPGIQLSDNSKFYEGGKTKNIKFPQPKNVLTNEIFMKEVKDINSQQTPPNCPHIYEQKPVHKDAEFASPNSKKKKIQNDLLLHNMHI